MKMDGSSGSAKKDKRTHCKTLKFTAEDSVDAEILADFHELLIWTELSTSLDWLGLTLRDKLVKEGKEKSKPDPSVDGEREQ